MEEMRQLAGRRKISCLTHIFHDGSMCFADMLKPYRQMGIPCLKPVYISDCLLGVTIMGFYISHSANFKIVALRNILNTDNSIDKIYDFKVDFFIQYENVIFNFSLL